ncbi:MAG: chemotaxis protein CheW [Nitrospirota bacterium]|mgnify:CR=1 FL=1
MERSDVDILAARKKAAERAKAAKQEQPVPVEQTPAESVPAGPAADFPPIPDTSFVPDEPVPAPLQASEAVHEAGPRSAQPLVPSVAAADAPPAGEQRKEPAPESGSEPGAETAQEQDLEMLSFLLGSEEYVVAVDRVREVLTPREITPVPNTPNYLLGVCSLRGTVMPIIDLNLRLGLSASVRDEKSRIIVVSLDKDDQVGLFVDRVRGVVRFAPSSVQPAPENIEQGAGAEFLKGIARKNDRLYILLDVEKAAGA